MNKHVHFIFWWGPLHWCALKTVHFSEELVNSINRKTYICSLIFLKSSKSCKATERPSAIRLQLSAPPPMNLKGNRSISRPITSHLNKAIWRHKSLTGCCRSTRQTQKQSWLARDTGHMTQEHSPPYWTPQDRTASLHTGVTGDTGEY